MSKLQETTSYFDENAGRVGVKSDTVFLPIHKDWSPSVGKCTHEGANMDVGRCENLGGRVIMWMVLSSPLVDLRSLVSQKLERPVAPLPFPQFRHPFMPWSQLSKTKAEN